jgi:3alpha(or 20beta)-hydroxysteroid dehydrogenase
MTRLDGKVALITGAARGTGAETARLFVERGARVLLTDVLDERGAKLAAELGEHAAYRRLDVRRPAEWATAVAEARARFGAPNVLVNNAAILTVAAIDETPPERAREIFDVNLLGPLLGIQAVLPSMRERGGGAIVNVASIDALEGEVGVAAYGASKWGLRGLTKCAGLELAHLGIRVNAVCPAGGGKEMSAPWYASSRCERSRSRSRGSPRTRAASATRWISRSTAASPRDTSSRARRGPNERRRDEPQRAQSGRLRPAPAARALCV